MMSLVAASLTFAPPQMRPLLQPAGTAAARAAVPTALEPTTLDTISSTLAFADQSGNLAGVLFPASLPPYLLFIYFIARTSTGSRPPPRTDSPAFSPL